MEKNLVEQIQSYYQKNNQMIFKKFKDELSINESEQNYINYYQKCMNLLNEIDEISIFTDCSKIEKDIKERIDQINLTKLDLISAVKEAKIIGINKNDENEILNYKSNDEDLKKKINELNNQIENLDLDSSLESLKKVKIENEKDSDYSFQPYYSNLNEKIKFYHLVKREKKSKLISLEEKKTTLNNNNFKIEKLKKEYTKNTERMKSELECNENLQKDITNLNNKIEEIKKTKDNINENNNLLKNEKILLNLNREEYIMKLKDMITQIKLSKSNLGKNNYLFSGILLLYMKRLLKQNKTKLKILAIELAHKLKQTIERRQKLIHLFNNINQSTMERMKRRDAFQKFSLEIQKVYEKFSKILKTLY